MNNSWAGRSDHLYKRRLLASARAFTGGLDIAHPALVEEDSWSETHRCQKLCCTSHGETEQSEGTACNYSHSLARGQNSSNPDESRTKRTLKNG